MADYKSKIKAFLDIETTGLDPNTHDIIQYGIILEWPDGACQEYSGKILPKNIASADPKALALNGYTEEAWEDAQTTSEAAQEIHRLLKGAVIIGHNVHFDLGFIQVLMAREGFKFFAVPAIDTMTLAWEHLGSLGIKSLSLKSTCEFVGVKPEDDVHDALAGATKCREIFCKLVRSTWLKRRYWAWKNRNQ